MMSRDFTPAHGAGPPDIGHEYSPSPAVLEGLVFVRDVLELRTVHSTNTFALSNAGRPGGVQHGTLVIADGQTAGRGRIGHSWHSPPGLGIYASLLLEPPRGATTTAQITLTAGLAVHRALSEALGEHAADMDLKWPNDVLWRGRKLSGILVESVLQGDVFKHVVVGFGINVGHEGFPDDIRHRAVSMYQISQKTHHRRDVLSSVVGHLDACLRDLYSGGAVQLLAMWERASTFARGKKVKFFRDDRPVLGITAGLNGDGALMVQCASGATVDIYSGEIFEY